MRQLARGVLATLVVVMAACGTNSDADAPSTASANPVDEAALAASSRTDAPDDAPRAPGSLTVTVTSPEGIDSPGLDAAVSVMIARPDFRVRTVAPAADVRDDPHGRASTPVSPVEATTSTGHPATVVNGSMLDAAEVITAGPDAPDLVVIGLTADAGPDSAAIAGARVAAERGIPVLAVAVGGDDPDLAGAALLLSMVTDYELDAIVESSTVHVLTVPRCDAGTVRGPVVVDPARDGDVVALVDCTSPDTGPFDGETDAWAAGHATLAHRD